MTTLSRTTQEHTFNVCPRRKIASKKALEKAQKSYKDALVVGDNKTHETAGPDHLERLLMTPEYSGVIERLFERFLQYLVSQNLIARQQAVQILTHTAANGSQAEVTEPTKEDEQEEKMESMEVDPKKSELTRQREGEAPTRGQNKARKGSREDLDCHQGCGFRGTKAGPLSQHEAACKGKSEEMQKSKGKWIQGALRRGHVSSTVLLQLYSMIAHSKSPLPCLTMVSKTYKD